MSSKIHHTHIGLQTEEFTLPDATHIDKHENYWVFATPERRDYIYGNSVFFLGRSVEENEKFITDYQSSRHDNSAFLAHFEYDHEYYTRHAALKDNPDAEIVFEYTNSNFPHLDKSSNVQLRKIEPEALVQAISDIVFEEYSEGAVDDFLLWRLDDYRQKMMRNEGSWYGLYISGELASTCGLFSSAGFNRFQMVITKKKYRRQGYGSHLITHILNRSDRDRRTIILATAGSIASAMYSKIGFEKQNVILSNKIQSA